VFPLIIYDAAQLPPQCSVSQEGACKCQRLLNQLTWECSMPGRKKQFLNEVQPIGPTPINYSAGLFPTDQA
jgi:hypothetical protein